MITHLRGKLIEKNQSNLIIDCNGVGYYIYISVYTYSSLSEQTNGKEIIIYTYLFTKEHKQLLYGFFDKIERTMFSHLISVNGIGPSSAINLLSSLTTNEIEMSIYQEDTEKFRTIKGIGNKTAKRIIIELKDKLGPVIITPKTPNEYQYKQQEALRALITLGFSHQESKTVLAHVINKNPELDLENIIKESLKKL
ncbi:Holliday junction branch migration protein RuvA [Blattabacterium cuenoti]|uniref:Holliday junction branch migration protein RuvA n=1 Tax=Blattabacterium cuenoti TaxID=1653831 RepID=UPI00163BF0F7|nr:Holliday junction branch migration protein RuvA [Blattabacterium cuenoti]